MAMRTRSRSTVKGHSNKGERPHKAPAKVVKFKSKVNKDAIAKQNAVNDKLDVITVYLIWIFTLVLSAPVSAVYMYFVYVKEEAKAKEDPTYEMKFKIPTYISFVTGLVYFFAALAIAIYNVVA